MTRQEFEDNITWWGDLIDVCQEYGCEICDDIYYGDTMDELLCDSIRDEINHRTWYEVKELLECAEWEGNDCYYRRDSEWDWHYLDDDDFFECRDEVEAWMVDNGYFPGANYAFLNDNQMYIGSVGNKSLIPNVEKNHINTLYDMASLSKVIVTNTIIARMLQKKKKKKKRRFYLL